MPGHGDFCPEPSRQISIRPDSQTHLNCKFFAAVHRRRCRQRSTRSVTMNAMTMMVICVPDWPFIARGAHCMDVNCFQVEWTEQCTIDVSFALVSCLVSHN